MGRSENNRAGLRGRRRAWTLLLALPYVGLCFPQMYVRLTPALWGFPFFYWYQFAWVLVTSAMLGFVYKMQKQEPVKEANGTL